MEAIKMINPYRDKIIDLVSKYSSEKVTIWVRKTLSLMIRKSFTVDNLYIQNRVALSIRNVYRYYKRFTNDEIGIFIAISLYMICIELDILNLGDEIESYDEFKEVTDEENWSNMSVAEVVGFDLYNSNIFYMKWLDKEELPLVTMGVYTACNVEAYIT